VDVDDAATGIVVEEVLAVRLGGLEAPAVKERGRLGEAALRGGDGDPAAGERGRMVARKTVGRVTFGHVGLAFRSPWVVTAGC
jgi:hypothetical protein